MLFSTTEQIKEVFSAPNINNELDSIKSYCKKAAIDYVCKYLSVAQYEKLVTDFNNNVNTDAHLKLLEKARLAIIHFAYYLYADDGDMIIGDRGFMRIESGDEKTAYTGQIQKFKRARLRDGWNAIEDMLKFLQQGKATYTLWAGSDEYKFVKSFFIWNTADYKKYRSIKNLGVLDTLRGCAIHVQDEMIANNIGDVLYAELKTQLAGDNYSNDNKLLIPFIQKAIAHLIVERGIDEGLIEMSEEGVSTLSFEDKDKGGIKISTPAATQLQFVKKEANKKGLAAIKELRDYLNANASASKYASYFNSSLYDDPADAENKHQFKPTEKGFYFSV